MSANFSEPPPEAGSNETRRLEDGPAQSGPVPTNGNVSFDPQQPLREYVSPASWLPSAPPVTAFRHSAYPAGPYQPAVPPYPAGYYPSNGYYGAYPAPPGYPPNAEYPGYYGAYPGYGYYPWPVKPKRDTYTLTVGIVAFAGSCLAILGGLGFAGFMVLALFEKSIGLLPFSSGQYFGVMMEYLALALAGLVGGGFCFYHSLRSLFLRKPSRGIWLPRFWIFLLCYLAILGVGLLLHTQGLDVAWPVVLGLLVILAGVFPALAILALGVRRVRFPQIGPWPTTWRRLVLALVSGATLSIALASLLELLVLIILVGSQSGGFLQFLNNPTSSNGPLFGLLVILAAVVAPLVEEMVKPLAVLVLIGRVRSKAEAFTLGLACGIGFNLVETTGYISQGYNDWLNVALGRSGAGLLHGFGAAMVALGWYILTHPQEGSRGRRVWLALACGGYAVLQHALWNGSVALILLPGPLGTFFQTWSWNLGPLYIDGYELVNIAEVIAILVFFIYMAGRLRTQPAEIPPAGGAGEVRVAVAPA